MRNLLLRFALWLLRYSGEKVRPGGDVVERAQRWDMFYREEGGLADMIRSLRASYFEAASAVGHRDDDKIYEFAVADRMARELEREVQKIIVTGKAEMDRRNHAAREEAARIIRDF